MTVENLNGTYASGVSVSASFTGVDTSSTTLIEGSGLKLLAYGFADNGGSINETITAGNGVYLSDGGLVVNELHAFIGGEAIGVKSGTGGAATGTVSNTGIIVGNDYAVDLLQGGSVNNTGTIGYYGFALDPFSNGGLSNVGIRSVGGSLNVTNSAEIDSQALGIYLTNGVIDNGSVTDNNALAVILGNTAIESTGATSVNNFGTIHGEEFYGVQLTRGGQVTNQSVGLIEGVKDAVYAFGGAILNYGTIQTTGAKGVGVYLNGSSTLTNGAAGDPGATIKGATAVLDTGLASITNVGMVDGSGGADYCGVDLGGGGALVNGAFASGFDDTGAQIDGYVGISLTSGGTITNFAQIHGTGPGAASYGVVMVSGGKVINGSDLDAQAAIEGYGAGVSGADPGGVVDNFAVIEAVGGQGEGAVVMLLGGTIVNGDLADHTALVAGPLGVIMGGPAAVANYGTIDGKLNQSLRLLDGGSVVNGAATDQVALIEGKYGLYSSGAALTLANLGSIQSAAGANGAVFAAAGGSVVNGSGGDENALIDGSLGVQLGASGTINNYGAIQGRTGLGVLAAGGAVINGVGTDVKALIQGTSGIEETAKATVVNLGVIDGVKRNSVQLVGGGTVINGDASDPAALIEGFYGMNLYAAASTVSNFGTIESVAAASAAVYSQAAGVVTNGAAVDRAATLQGGLGVHIKVAGTVTNYGSILGATGAGVLAAGGRINNGLAGAGSALIRGLGGVSETASAVVQNMGVIDGTSGTGVLLAAGGTVTNGAAAISAALIEGLIGVDLGAAGTIRNFGTINGGQGIGAYLKTGGVLVNGAASDPGALIEGYLGVAVYTAIATITNFGTVQSSEIAKAAVLSKAGGSLVNGSAADRNAMIQGYLGVSLGAVGTVTNYGGIVGQGAAGVQGAGGAVVNGKAGDSAALIRGVYGVIESAGATISNLGLIDGGTGIGIDLAAGGGVTNGTQSDRTATVEGYHGVFAGGSASVANLGTILAEAVGAYAIRLAAGGDVTNGSASDGSALIQGYGGLWLEASGASANFGTIVGLGGTAGVYMSNGASLINGSAGHAGALIEGQYGVAAGGTAITLTNFGTIASNGSTAVNFNTAGDELIVEAGSAFIGAVDGDGGTIVLASGTGTLSLLGSDVLAVSGSMAATTFSNFATVEVASGANFAATGLLQIGVVSAGQSLIDAGTLTVAGTLSVAGNFTGTGALSGTGTLALAGGTAAFNAGSTLTIAKVSETKAGSTATVGLTTLAYAGVWTQTAGTVSAGGLGRVNFSGAGDSFAGTLGGAGTVAFVGGSDLLSGATISATTALINGATVTLAGNIDLTTTLTVTTPDLVIAAGGATLSGGGSLALTNAATNIVVGAGASATLTNATDAIKGAGQLGDGTMTLVNDAGGLIEGTGTVALVINTGTNTILNAGTIQADAAGGVTVSGPLDNTGVLVAVAGTLAVQGTVTGTGHVSIDGGVADFAGGFTQNVGFTGTTGELELGNSKTYTGDITGFSKTGTTSLDLLDIAFAGNTTASFTGTATSGVLTVTEGANTAKITLEGNYLSSTFTLSAAVGGGTLVVDPSKAASAPSHPIAATPLHTFVAAMASIGPPAGGPAAPDPDVFRAPPPMIASSRTQMA